MTLLEIQSLEKTFVIAGTDIPAIRGITINIEQGEFIAILGKSGSGKSTLLSLIGGLEQPSEGKVILNGNNLSMMSENELAKLRRTEIGIVFQHFYLMNVMTALENVELPLIITGKEKNERRKWAMEILSYVGLDERATHYPSELSGGQRQRVGIARAFANKPSIIIADEPTGNLDTSMGEEIIELLYHLNQGGEKYPGLDWKPTIIMVTHDIGMLRKGMRVLTISDGSIIQDAIFDGDHEKFDPLGLVTDVVGVDYQSDTVT